MEGRFVREAVGVFLTENALQQAVDELLIAGFDRSALSLLSSKNAVEKKLGHDYEKVDELEDDLTVPRRAFVGRDSPAEGKGALIGGLAYIGAVCAAGGIVASGGTIAVAVLAATAAGGAGGAIGVLLGQVMDRGHARRIEEQLEKGGLLLWVRTLDEAQETRACALLAGAGARDVHVHELPQPTYSFAGGQSYDMSFMKRLGL